MPISRYHKLIGHILFWIGSICLSLFLFYVYGDFRLKITAPIISKVLTYNIGFAIATYTNLYLLFRYFLKKRKFILYFFSLFCTLTASALFIHFTFLFPLNHLFDPQGDFSTFRLNILLQFFFSSTGYVLFTSIMKVVDEWIELQNVKTKLKETERQHLHAELTTLKAQINPHFFFNALNNIYSLALENSKSTPDMILKLSELMRHVLYGSNSDFIDIDKELVFIENYIELQKIRYTSHDFINYTKQIDAKFRVAPLIFQPFIENAFKHGAKSSSTKSFIDIKFKTTSDNQLFFFISNRKSNPSSSNNGIGIENVRKRLKLLYPEQHILQLTETADTFNVELKIEFK